MIVLAEFQPFDPVTNGRVTLRATSANDKRVTGLNDQVWSPAISGIPTIGIRLFKGDFDGTSAPAGGNITLQIDKMLRQNANARRFVWQGAPVKLYAGVSGQAWPWQLVLEAKAKLQNADGNKIALSLDVNTRPFEADVLTAKYAGTGGAEGGADLKGKVKPFLAGRCFNVEPVLIDAVNNVYQVHGYGPIEAITTLFERGSAFPAPIADYASYAALVAADIPNSQWASCLAIGMFRLGAPAYGVITADVDGDKHGGTWRDKTGAVILRLAQNAGVSTGIIETASFTGLDTAMLALPEDGQMGIYITDQTNVLEIASRLTAPCNAQAGVSLLGKLFCSIVTVGIPSTTLDAQQRQKPRVVSSVEQSVSEPYSFLEFGYARSWRVHNEDEIATDSSPENGATNDANLDDPTQLIINEKIRLIDSEEKRVLRRTVVRARLIDLGLSVSALDTAEANWLAHRNAISPAWNNISAHSTINRSTYRTLDQAFTAALDAADKAISEEDARRAAWTGVVDDGGKPDPYATGSDSVIKNGALLNSAKGWLLVGSATPEPANPGAPCTAWVLFPSGTTSEVKANDDSLIQLDGANTLFFSCFTWRGGAISTFNAVCIWYRADGSLSTITVQQVHSIIPATVSTWTPFLRSFTRPSDATQFRFRIFATGNAADCYLAGAVRLAKTEPEATLGASFADNVTDIPLELTDGRIAAGLDDEGAVRRNLPATIGMAQSPTVARALPRGVSYVALRDGDVYNFPVPWGSGQVPFVSGPQIYQDPSNYLDCKALNVTSSGFTADCKRVTPGTLTTQTETTAGTASSPRSHEIVKGVTAEAHNDSYRFQFDVSVTNQSVGGGEWDAGSVTVGVWTYDGATWQMNQSVTVYGVGTGASTAVNNVQVTVSRDGMGLNDRFGLSIETSDFGGSITSFDHVKYETTSGNTISSATPTGYPAIEFKIAGGLEA